MNLKFRKKPVVIEAFQMTTDRRHDNRDWPEWLNAAWQSGTVRPGHSDIDQLVIETLEGNHHVTWGDWIIQGVKGELYPCKPDIFTATYDPA